MSTLRRISRVFIPIRACSSGAHAKIKEISENHSLQAINEYGRHNARSYRINLMRQRFQNKRKIHTQEQLEDPDQYHPLIFSLISAQSGSEILDILNQIDLSQYSHQEMITNAIDPSLVDIHDAKEEPTIHRIFCKAIRCCADLGEIDVCWKIFKQCKKDEIISNQLYNTMMWVSMYDNRDSKSLKKVLQLKAELDKKIVEYKLQIDARTYSTLIHSCNKARDLHQGLKILDYVKRKHPELLTHTRLVAAASNLLVQTSDIDGACKLIDSMSEIDEKAWCRFDAYQLNRMLFKIASCMSNKGFEGNYTEKAERIFQKCVGNAIKYNVEIPSGLFAGMMDVYASNDDFDSCAELLRYMIDPEKKHKLFPRPNARVFERMVQSLKNHENDESKWKKLNSVFKVMEKVNVVPSHYSFSLVLICVCGDDIERAKGFYNDMINIYQIPANMAVLDALFDVGMRQYQNSKDNESFKQFVEWIIAEYSKYNILPTKWIKFKWKAAVGHTDATTCKTMTNFLSDS